MQRPIGLPARLLLVPYTLRYERRKPRATAAKSLVGFHLRRIGVRLTFDKSFPRITRQALVTGPDLFQVIVTLACFNIGDLSRRRIGVGRVGMYPIAHLARLDREHASKLAAAEYTDS